MDNQVIVTRLNELRKLLNRHHLSCYIIPTNDFHGSEYVGAYFKTRQYMSGFTGSAGTLIVTLTEALLWTDGRYFLQAENELKGSTIKLMKSGEPGVPTMVEYLKDNLEPKARIGFDGRTLSTSYVKMLLKSCQASSFELVYDLDLVDQVWHDRPQISKEPVIELALKYTGLSRSDKIKEVRCHLEKRGAKSLILTSLDDICYLLNLRGNDVMCNPVVLAYVIITSDTLNLYIHHEVLDEAITKSLKEDGITIKPYNDIYRDVNKYSEGALIDESKVNYAIYVKLVKPMVELNYTTVLKACKNEVEQKNAYLAHLKDGVACTKFIYWLKHHEDVSTLTELDCVEKLQTFRSLQDNFKGISFETIAGYKEHGAIIHYDPSEETNIPLAKKSFILIDSGGQYLEGTTDITRTIALGKLAPNEKLLYTAVLKGHLALSNAKFKEGTTGGQLDILARLPLYEIGLNYNHGTGHGVGMYLNVHEGPQSINAHPTRSSYPLKPGMIISNEPGVYIENEFGIRIENLILVKPYLKTNDGQFYNFDNLTLCPYEVDAINKHLLTEVEKHLIHEYHERVYDKLSPYLTEEENLWLKQIIEAI